VQQISRESSRGSFVAQRFVEAANKSCGIFPVQPLLKIRIPPGVLDPRTQIPGFPSNFVYLELRRSLLPIQDRGLQSAAKLFVGVKRKDPLGLRE
jgi:hypothetical protein